MFLLRIKQICKIFGAGVLVFTLSRVLLWLYFFAGLGKEVGYYWIFRAFVTGFRFDATSMCFALLPLVLFAYLLEIPSSEHIKRKLESAYNATSKVLIYIIFLLVFILSVIDFFFNKFFHEHINILFFGIFQDDTKAVLQSVWADYPVLGILLLLLGYVLALYKFIQKIISQSPNFQIPKMKYTYMYMVFFLPVYFLGLRGSLGFHPLEVDDMSISPYPSVNNLTINGVFALKTAYTDWRDYAIETDISTTLKDNNISDVKQMINTYMDTTLASVDENHWQKYLFKKTPHSDFLLQHPPHVIVVQMESMSNYYFDLHSPSFNLLGTLAQELPHCYLFRNFTSCKNGTIHTLEFLTTASPQTPLAQSVYMNRPLLSATALPFQRAGYQTRFITGGKLTWRNIDKYLPLQGFKNLEGNADILSHVKGAQETEWGVFDEYVFDRMFQLLSVANAPQYIFAMTTTNHTPYEITNHYKVQPIVFPKGMERDFRCASDIAYKNFRNYQYANDCLGRFIEKIRQSPLGKNTIIVATGDHNTLHVFDFSDDKIHMKRGVPLVMYVPEAYKPQHFQSMYLKRWASHKDIFPTIFPLALSDQSYFFSGNNLFSENSKIEYFADNDFNLAISDAGAVYASRGLTAFSGWDSKNSKLKSTTQPQPNLLRLQRKHQAYIASMQYAIYKQLHN